MKLHGVIFDLDGTLGDTLPVCCAAFRRVLMEFVGREFADHEIMALFGPSEEGIIQRLVPDAWQACLQAYLREYDAAHGRYSRPFPGIHAALGALRERDVCLAIVTGKGGHSAAISLRHLGLAPHFPVVETGSAEGAVKPVAIRKVLARWGAPPAQVAYVGDAPYDMQAAREAGVMPLAAAWASTADPDTLRAQAPLAIFRTVERFAAWIEAHVERKGG